MLRMSNYTPRLNYMSRLSIVQLEKKKASLHAIWLEKAKEFNGNVSALVSNFSYYQAKESVLFEESSDDKTAPAIWNICLFVKTTMEGLLLGIKEIFAGSKKVGDDPDFPSSKKVGDDPDFPSSKKVGEDPDFPSSKK